ncbi:MAG: DUF3306 domain-containing protein [Burkholderiaceae bacterium]
MADGFISRWARKKQLDRAIEKSAQVVETDHATESMDASDSVDARGDLHPDRKADGQQPAQVQAAKALPAEGQVSPDDPIPDVEQAKQLPVGADVSRYMKADVPEEARREALQKLFSDPMYNVISEMDDYVEDYSNLPNLSREELKTLNHVKGLFLFEDPPWKIEAEREERLAAEEALRRQAAAGAGQAPGSGDAESTPEPGLEPTLEGTGANIITVSPPPPHLSRPKPAEVKGKDDPFATPAEDAAEPVVLSGRRYQPTRRQDPS